LNRKISRRTAGVLGAAVATTLGLISVTPSAYAANSPLVDPSMDGKGSINITKLGAPPVSISEDTGAQQSGLSNVPIEGVQFAIQKVLGVCVGGLDAGATACATSDSHYQKLDLTTAGGWSAASWAESQVTLSSANAVFGSVIPGSTATDATGQLVFSNLAFGMYSVTETDSADPSWVPAAPFYVTVPMTNPSGDGWMYDIYTYPKNSKVQATKTVSDVNAITAGDPISYTILSDVPVDVDENPVTHVPETEIDTYVVQDQIDNRITVSGSSAVTVSLAPAGAVSLTTSDYGITVVNNMVTVTFNAQGLGKLESVALNTYGGATPQQVQVIISGNVNNTLNTQLADANGIIPNTATVFPDKISWDANVAGTHTGVTTNTVQTYYGGAMIHKEDASTNTPLAGASFEVFQTATDAANMANKLSAQDTSGATQTEFATNADGEVGILGLKYDPVNGTCTKLGKTGTPYWIVETQAPSGYELLTTPVQICLVGVLDGTDASYDDWYVPNVAHNAGFPMPFTGLLDDSVSLPAIGAVIVVAGAAVYLLRARKENARASHNTRWSSSGRCFPSVEKRSAGYPPKT